MATLYPFDNPGSEPPAVGAAEAFLGPQGDIWGTQWDMLLALPEALAAQLFLSRVHDRALKQLPAPSAK